jgi:hypothetical protein
VTSQSSYKKFVMIIVLAVARYGKIVYNFLGYVAAVKALLSLY